MASGSGQGGPPPVGVQGEEYGFQFPQARGYADYPVQQQQQPAYPPAMDPSMQQGRPGMGQPQGPPTGTQPAMTGRPSALFASKPLPPPGAGMMPPPSMPALPQQGMAPPQPQLTTTQQPSRPPSSQQQQQPLSAGYPPTRPSLSRQASADRQQQLQQQQGLAPPAPPFGPAPPTLQQQQQQQPPPAFPQQPPPYTQPPPGTQPQAPQQPQPRAFGAGQPPPPTPPSTAATSHSAWAPGPGTNGSARAGVPPLPLPQQQQPQQQPPPYGVPQPLQGPQQLPPYGGTQQPMQPMQPQGSQAGSLPLGPSRPPSAGGPPYAPPLPFVPPSAAPPQPFAPPSAAAATAGQPTFAPSLPPAPAAAELERPSSRGPVARHASLPSTPERSRDVPQLGRQQSLPSQISAAPRTGGGGGGGLGPGPLGPGTGPGLGYPSYRIQGRLEPVEESSPEAVRGSAEGGGPPRRRWNEGAPEVSDSPPHFPREDTRASRAVTGRQRPYPPSDDDDHGSGSSSGGEDDRYTRTDQRRGIRERGGGGRRREPHGTPKGRRRRSYDSGEYTPDFTDDDDVSTSYRSPKRDKYKGDISAWGNRRISDFYDDKTNSESAFTMSSGLSPRDTKPREREFDMEAAKKTLMYNAGMYGRAQAMRKEGQAPAAVGIADDLPNRFAFEQLNALSGMASKVQDAINHNKALFQHRLWLEDSTLMRKVLHAWRARKYGSVQKQQVLLRAIQRLRRGTLSRAFFKWKDQFHIVDKNLAMRRKVAATIARGLLKRTFLEWKKLEEERWWKNQYAMRDETIHMLERKINGYERRPIMVLRKRLMSKVINAWFVQAEGRRHRRQRAERGLHYWLHSQYVKAWNAWTSFVDQKLHYKGLLVKASKRMQNIELASAWSKWCELVDIRREKEQRKSKALRFWLNHTQAIAWRTWLQFVDWRREKKKIISRWMFPVRAKAFRSWYIAVQERKRLRLTGTRVMRRMLNSRLAAAFYTWLEEVEGRKMDEQMSTKEELALKVRDMQEENERLRRDNERFVRLIDSGEWGRGRVSELVSAGEILKGERDALLKLIQSMRREYEAVQTAKGTQEDEMRALKDRMLLGGAARNRMLVKGGSAFNGLMRAMKQDLVEGGAGAGATRKDPNALYEIDKLSMDKVIVFPDGELNVDAVASVPGTAAFHRPISAGRALPHGPPGSTTLGPNMSPPPHPMRMPPDFAHGIPRPGAGGPMGGGGSGLGRERPMSPTPHRSVGGGYGGRAHLGEGAAGRPSAGAVGMPARDQQRVLSTLQSLTPAEVERLEATIRASAPHLGQQRGGQARPPSARP